jgi:vitamin B12 transporter
LRQPLVKQIGILVAALVLALGHARIVRAVSAAEQSFLSLYFTEDELRVVSATRSLQSVARIAENIEVVTAADIELMNAHTLGEVLNSITGVKVNFTGSFGAAAMAYLQGSEFDHVTVLLDGVRLNNLTDNVTEVGFFPVTDIEKIEIVKGPASSAWGSALGGVVNVITKSPGTKPVQGMASLDYGAKNSADYRAAISGRIGRFGYYLSGTGLRTDGLTDGFDVHARFLGSRLEYAFTDDTSVRLSVAYGSGPRGDGNSPPDNLSWDRDNLNTVVDLALQSAIGPQGHLEASLSSFRERVSVTMRQMSDGVALASGQDDSRRLGATLKYAWRLGANDLVLGGDWSSATLDTSSIPDREPKLDQRAVFFNDTVTRGPLAISPGLRYDYLSNAGSIWSPSLGATWAVSSNSLLRASVARGFSAPTTVATSGSSTISGYVANPHLQVEEVWAYQAGIESNLLDAVWLKFTLFRHDLQQAFSVAPLADQRWTTVNAGSQRRQGVEIEAKTVPVHHLSLEAGAFFLKAEDRDTGEEITEVPKRQYKVDLTYDDGSFRALLHGDYRDERYDPVYAAYLGGFIFDLNLARRFALGGKPALEAFLTVHNLFNGNQYYYYQFPNPHRWAEGGLRVSF